MLKRLVLVGAVVMFFFGAVNAQVSYPVNNLNYMMGTVSVPVQSVTSPTSSLPMTPVVVPSTPATSTACVAMLTTFQKFGDNSPEVAKLQNFLNTFAGANLNGKGFYGPATRQEVMNLQYAYGIKPTGAQFEKTTALINGISCGNVAVKARMVYKSTQGNYSYSAPLSNSANEIENIYPNPDGMAQVKPIASPANTVVTKPVTKPAATTTVTNSTTSPATTSSFASNLKNDFEKIKENYKAYVLVFVLVLALFWFLRKAATE